MLRFASSLLGFSLLLLGNVRGDQSDCTEGCEAVSPDTDCCSYYSDEVYSYCRDAMGDTSAYDNCDAEDTETPESLNDTNITVWDCSLGWDIDFVGKSGQFKLFPCDDTNFFIKVNLQTVQEYTADGQKLNDHKVTAFSYASAKEGSDYTSSDSVVYSWHDADGNDAVLGGVTLTYYWRVTDDTLTTFIMNLYLIDDVTIIETTNTHGNVTYTEELSQGTLKFDYIVRNWPFDADDNQLQIDVRLTTGGTTNDGSSGGGSDGSARFSWGDEFVVDMPETYSHTTSDGTETGKDVEVDFDTTGSGKQVDVTFLFKDAGDAYEINYDPNTYSKTGRSESGAFTVSSQLALFVVALAAIFLH